MRVAAAVDFLVVVQAHVEHHRAHGPAFHQQLVAALGVALHHRELLVGELARLVEHTERHQHLAQVVQHARQAGLLQLIGGQAQLAPQRHHQRAHGHRMHVGVFVAPLEPRHADQRAGVAQHRLRDLLDQRFALGRIDRPAQAGLAEQQGDLRHRPSVQRRGGGQGGFIALGFFDLERHRGGELELALDFDRHVFAADDSLAGSAFRIEALVGVDPQLLDAADHDALHVGFGAERELGAPERVVHPRAAELVDVHAHPQLADRYFLDHGGPSEGVCVRPA